MNKEFAELKNKSSKELEAELMVAREDQFTLRIKHKTGQLNETSQLGDVKKENSAYKNID